MAETWLFPRWEQNENGNWVFMQGDTLVGEAYPIEHGNGFKWHCKTSDERDFQPLSMEQAKAECEASFWKEAWHKLRDSASLGASNSR